MRASVTLCLCIAAIGCGKSDSDGKPLELEFAESRKANELLEELTEKQASDLKQLEAATQGAKDALKSETERANRLAEKLNTTEMELSDAELLITALQEEIKRTRAALQNAQADAERKAFERLKAELEKRRATAQQDLEARAAERKKRQAAWNVALEKVLPGAKRFINGDAALKRYVASFGFADDRPLFNVRVRPKFLSHERATVEAEARRLVDKLTELVRAGIAHSAARGHAPEFGPVAHVRFYDPMADEKDDTIGRVVAESKDGLFAWRE